MSEVWNSQLTSGTTNRELGSLGFLMLNSIFS